MAFIDELRGYAKAMANRAVSGVDYPLGACAEAMSKAAQEIERLSATMPRQIYEFKTFGPYTWKREAVNSGSLDRVLNSLMSDGGWECFSTYAEYKPWPDTMNFLLHCKRLK